MKTVFVRNGGAKREIPESHLDEFIKQGFVQVETAVMQPVEAAKPVTQNVVTSTATGFEIPKKKVDGNG